MQTNAPLRTALKKVCIIKNEPDVSSLEFVDQKGCTPTLPPKNERQDEPSDRVRLERAVSDAWRDHESLADSCAG